MSELPPPLHSLFRERASSHRRLTVDLPPGRVVLSSEVENWPVLWLSDGPAPPGLWASLRADHAGSGLWPIILEGLEPRFRPWVDGELYPHEMSDPDESDGESVLANLWSECQAEGDEDDPPEPPEDLAPFGVQWPGLAPTPSVVDSPEEVADEYADRLLTFLPTPRLGLVAADRGADALAIAGWMGPCNHTNDTGELAAVLRNWEDRFGARVVGVGFDTLYLSVAAPPATGEAAVRVAAEHFAFCPDNIWQGWEPFTLTGYARRLVNARSWNFWWD